MISYTVNFIYYGLSILIAIVLLIFVYYKRKFYYWKKLGLYTPKPSIPFGNISNLYFKKRNFGEIFADAYEDIRKSGAKHGGMYFWAKPVYVPVDNAIVKKMIISDFEYFVNHGLYINEEDDPMSGHIFNMEDSKWRNLRAKIPSAFTTAKMRKMFINMAERKDGLISLIDKYSNGNKPVDIKKILTRFSTDIITRAAFGIETNCLKEEDTEFIKHGRSFFDDQWSVLNNTLVVLTPRHILKFFNFKLYKKEAVDFFTKLFGDIKTHREKLGSTRNDLTDLLLRLTKNNTDDDIFKDIVGKNRIKNLNFNEYAAQAYVFFEAGFETSSTAMTFALYSLATNLECQDNLRKEINTVLEKYNGELTYDAVLEMDYLDKVVDETLRLYPPFPIMPRICNTNYKVPGTDLTLEKDILCMVTMMGIHKDPEYWPKPEKFDPERFSKENKAKRPSCSYMPFGEGPRICIGKRFGIFQTKVGLATIIRHYEVLLSEKNIKPLRLNPATLILNIHGDLWLDFNKLTA